MLGKRRFNIVDLTVILTILFVLFGIFVSRS